MRVPRETEGRTEELFGGRLSIAEAYADVLATTGVERGLIGPREVPRIWDRHILNCVVLSELIPEGIELADLGSGAGLPGLPLAIARPDLSVFLVEPLLRRVVWLRETVLTLGLSNVEIIRARAAVVADVGRSFDVVTARAVASLPTLAGWCIPLVKPGGQLLAIKGDAAQEELTQAEPTLATLGATSWLVVSCGEGVVDPPTRVVAITAGSRRPPQLKGAAQRPSRVKRPVAPKSRRPGSPGGRSRPRG
jgi:16S rRNA (guanine527-N7)-methyltransferase